MKQEDKDLLLKDLCARLPYGVIGEYSWKGREPYNKELTGNLYDELNSSWSSTEDSKFVPYLYPMSSMTDEQKVIYGDLCYAVIHSLAWDMQAALDELFDWLNKNHFDHRKLIPMGLAIDATGLNIY